MSGPAGASRFPRRLRLLAGLGLAGALAACEVGPDFSPPAAPTADRYTPEQTPAATVSADIAGGNSQVLLTGEDVPGRWWELFHSPALNTLVDQSLKASPTLQAAQALLRQARENVVVQRGAFLPTVSGNLQGTRERTSGASFGTPGFNPQFTLYNANVSVSYVPDVFGGTRRQLESVEAQAENIRYQLEATYITLTANIVTAAVQEASLRGQIAATQDILAAERGQLDIVQRQFDLGGASKADVLAQQATVAQAEATLPPLQKSLSQIRSQLSVYAGAAPSEDTAGRFTLDALELPGELPVTLPSKLVQQRPDIREAEAQLHAASAEIGVAVANMFPQITLSGSFGDSASKLADLFNPASEVWNIGAGLVQPLVQEYTLLHQKRAAEAAFDQAAALYRSTVLTAFQDVANALHAVASDAEALRAQVAAERAAADSLAIAQSQYNLGAINYLTLLNAERTYQETRLSLVQGQANRYSDTAALFQALGGGWWNGEDPAEAPAAQKQ